MKITIPSDCGNSPKNKLIADLTIAFSEYNLENVENYLANDIIWTLEGDIPIKGKENFLNALKKMSSNPAEELIIFQILTHGKEGAIKGEMKLRDGSIFSFADFYIFKSAKSQIIKSINSFVISK